MRASRRDRGREIASNRMLHDVPKADVVIVNPSHYAVALKWSRGDGTVPVCVAKGVDEVARRIRVRADQAGVPVHSDPPTARSLHALVEVGHAIAPEHYKAVAAAIVLRHGSTLSEDELSVHLAERLAAFKIPTSVWFREVPLPRNASGKFLKTSLQSEYGNRPLS